MNTYIGNGLNLTGSRNKSQRNKSAISVRGYSGDHIDIVNNLVRGQLGDDRLRKSEYGDGCVDDEEEHDAGGDGEEAKA